MSQALMQEISSKVSRFTGWESVDATLNGDVLIVECEGYTLLHYNLRNSKEVYGRICRVGFSVEELQDLALRLFK